MDHIAILSRLGIQGVTIRTGDTGEYHWLTVEREVQGRHASESFRFPMEPNDNDFHAARARIEGWLADLKEAHG